MESSNKYLYIYFYANKHKVKRYSTSEKYLRIQIDVTVHITHKIEYTIKYLKGQGRRPARSHPRAGTVYRAHVPWTRCARAQVDVLCGPGATNSRRVSIMWQEKWNKHLQYCLSRLLLPVILFMLQIIYFLFWIVYVCI